jgi:hypothetical protein
MIVRISGEAQYKLADTDADRLNELEQALINVLDSGREDGFAQSFAALLDFVRTHGSKVPDDELESSDVILPPPDLTYAEAGREFTGDGLIPD